MKTSREACIAMLKAVFEEKERLPQKSDFSEADTVAIKAHLGPWPRALEAAGLKPARPVSRLELNREKRARRKAAKRPAEAMAAVIIDENTDNGGKSR